MSAATSAVTVPLFQGATQYWQTLTDECSRLREAINEAASQKGAARDELIQWHAGPAIRMTKAAYPSTSVKVSIDFPSWGPVISGSITGRPDGKRTFASDHFEMPIARDLDGGIVAIFDEGRSFSPRELACYLAQSFHRCYPRISLPC